MSKSKPEEQDLPLDMTHDVISEMMATDMVEMANKARDKRVKRPRKQMHDYVQELLETNVKYNVLKAKYEHGVEENKTLTGQLNNPTIGQAVKMLWRAIVGKKEVEK